jgi:hypothetical protein
MDKTRKAINGMFTFDGEYDVIEENGTIYAPIIRAIGTVATKEAAPKKDSPAAPVVDDTKGKATKPAKETAPAATAPASATKNTSTVELNRDELELGQKVQVQLDLPQYKDQLFGAEVVKKEEGKVFVKFFQDGETDYLRPTDKVYGFDFKF